MKQFFNLSIYRLIKPGWMILWVILILGVVSLPQPVQSAFIIISQKEEADLGRQAFEEIKKKYTIANRPAENEQVQRVAKQLLKAMGDSPSAWEIVLIENSTPNAFALPGNKIGVHTGILPITKTDAGLAAVLGHEISHVKLRHAGQRYTQNVAAQIGFLTLGAAMGNKDPKTREVLLGVAGTGTQVGVLLPFSRKHELEADRDGLKYMAKAGYDPREAITFWERMRVEAQKQGSPPEFLSTHPSDKRRIQELKKMLPNAIKIYDKSKKS